MKNSNKRGEGLTINEIEWVGEMIDESLAAREARIVKLEAHIVELEAHIVELEAERDVLISGIEDALLAVSDAGTCYDILQGLLDAQESK